MKIIINESDIRAMVKEAIDKYSSAIENGALKLSIGYNFHSGIGGIEDEFAIFSIVYSVGGDEETVAQWVMDGKKPIPSEIKVKVHLDNLDEKEGEFVMEKLNCGGCRGQYAYDDDPDEKYDYAIADIKPFICRHIDEGLQEFLNKKSYPDWQKKRLMQIVNSAKEDNWS